MKELDKQYDPQKTESKIYEKWEKGGYFRPEINPDGKPFTIVMPPPNITGQLHIGHAFDCTLQDILTRYKRMQGYSALWLPGEDHASIATEVKVVEKILKEEGLTKQDLGREEFLKRAWEWTGFYRKRIADQLKKMGASCDWSRERFTLDEGVSKAVVETFVRLYNKGLIYRGNRIINWCPKCRTALSDAEVEYSEQAGHLWYIRYPIENTSEFMVVATTRPETMLGDTGVAVNPNDERFSKYVGKYVILPLVGRRMPIVSDEYVDMEFGTGCVKMTPCHDPNDFEVGLRHNLEQIKVLDDDGKISFDGKYFGLDRYEAREKIVEDLKDGGYLVKVEDYTHNVGECYRCKTTVETMTSLQWFVKMEPLAKPAIKAVKEDEVKFIPDRFAKIYFNWMENIRDWCISRQLWWGHRIPAYYCDNCGEVVVSEEMPEVCPKCSSTKFTQEEDVLDTWFSSALWPFSTLGWPEETPDLKKFYPNDVLVTAFDIIFFWVARMIFSGISQMGKPPFHHVYIHGLVRDSEGRKMSKSLGNGVDPLKVAEEYGADALRFTLITGNAAGNDTRWHESKVQSNRNFVNKINNAARFILMNLDGFSLEDKIDENKLHMTDKWILSRCNSMINEVTVNLEKYEMGIAAEKLYNFIWNEFCDWYIEFVKPRLNVSGSDKLYAQYTLHKVFTDILKLLHPFMPFITEEIYSYMPKEKDDMLICAKWPVFSRENEYAKDEEAINLIIDAIRQVRNARTNMNIPPSKKANGFILCQNEEIKNNLKHNEDMLKKLAYFSSIDFTEDDIKDALCVVTSNVKIFIPMGELVDINKERERLSAEEKKLIFEFERLEKKLSNEAFISKAPENIVKEEREKQEKYALLLKDVREQIKKLN